MTTTMLDGNDDEKKNCDSDFWDQNFKKTKKNSLTASRCFPHVKGTKSVRMRELPPPKLRINHEHFLLLPQFKIKHRVLIIISYSIAWLYRSSTKKESTNSTNSTIANSNEATAQHEERRGEEKKERNTAE